MNTEEILQNGYKQFLNCLLQNNEMYVESYQKCFRDEKGKKYFITIDKFLFKDKEIIEANNQFRSNGMTINVEVLINNQTVQEIENFYENFFVLHKCDYYEEIY